MDEHINQDLLPFYVNQTLDAAQTAQIRAHLQTCGQCREELEEWKKIAGAASTEKHDAAPPRLSPLVEASLVNRPSLNEAAASAVHLIWSQRVFIANTWLLPSVGSLIGSGALAALIFGRQLETWVTVPLFAVVPMAAALITAFLYTFEDDPLDELISALPTSPATLLFARLSLALSAITLMGFIGSLAIALLGQASHSIFDVVVIWLGPMLLLSAVTTVLSLRLHPRVASGAVLGLWGTMLCLLLAERSGTGVPGVSLLWLLRPGWALFVGQAAVAGWLWWLAWRSLSDHTRTSLHLSGK
jgi:hypothetical protein